MTTTRDASTTEDDPRAPDVSPSGDIDAHAGAESGLTATPRWVKVSAIVALILVVLVVVMLLLGGGPGSHGPSRH